MINEILNEKIKAALDQEFISTINFTDDEIDEMKLSLMEAVENFDERANKYFYQNEIKELIILIVHYAKNWGDNEEGRFWVKIFANIFETYTFNANNNRFYDEIEKVFISSNKILFRSQSGKRMVRETLLFHALAPKSSVQSFIKLLFNCCIEDAYIDKSYMLDSDVYEKLAMGLNKKFSKSNADEMDEDIAFDGATYAIRAGIKYACVQSKQLITYMIANIMRGFSTILCDNQDLEDNVLNSYIKETINQVFTQDSLKSKHVKINREPIVSDFSKIYTYYEIIDNKPYLSLPEIRIFDEDMQDVEIMLYNNQNLVDARRTEIVGNGFKRKIKKMSFNLLNYKQGFYDTINLSVIIKVDGLVIYDSKESAFRKFIIFNNSKEIKNDTRPGTFYIVYPNNAKIEEITNASIQGLGNNFACITANENQYVNYKGKIIFFNSIKQNSHIVIKGNEIEFATFSTNDNEYKVYNNIESISLLCDHQPKFVFCKINNNLPLTVENEHISIINNQFIVDLSKIKLEHKNQITFFDEKAKIIKNFNFAIFNNLRINYNRDYYFLDQTGNVNFTINGEVVNFEFIDGSVDETIIQYEDGYLIIKNPNIKYRLDDKDWINSPHLKPIWYKSLHSGTLLKIHNNSNCKLSIFNNQKEIQSFKKNEYLIGNLLTNGDKNDCNLVLKCEEDIYNIFKICKVETIYKDPEFSYIDGYILHDIPLKFIGDENSSILIILHNDLRKYEFKIEVKEEMIHAPNIVEDYYDIEVYLIIENLYGDEKKLLTKLEDIPIGNVMKLEFENSRINLQSVRIPTSRIKFSDCKIDNIVYLREDLYPVYSGVLFQNKKRIPVEFERKDDNTIKIYTNFDNNLKLINVNARDKNFTTLAHNNKDIFECFSCYYKKEKK